MIYANTHTNTYICIHIEYICINIYIRTSTCVLQKPYQTHIDMREAAHAQEQQMQHLYIHMYIEIPLILYLWIHTCITYIYVHVYICSVYVHIYFTETISDAHWHARGNSRARAANAAPFRYYSRARYGALVPDFGIYTCKYDECVRALLRMCSVRY